MRHRPGPRLRAEALEPRLALSFSAAHVAASRNTPLVGELQVQLEPVPGTNQIAVLGAGSVHPLGPVVATGTLRAGRSGKSGHVMLIYGDQNLDLNVQIGAGSTPGGPRVTFTIVGGSAAYAGASGQGTASWGPTSPGAGGSATLSLALHGTVKMR